LSFYLDGNWILADNFHILRAVISWQEIASLYSTTAHSNTTIGYSPLTSNTTGWGNSAVGYHSLAINTTGNYNTAFGYNANVGDTDLLTAINNNMNFDQNQHIIPQTFLKQFGYKDKHGRWKVPTFNVEEIPIMNDINKTLVKQSNIESLLREQNIYDLSGKIENKKQLDNTFKILEDCYPSIIKEINETKRISNESKEKLITFISFLFIRTHDFREIAEHLLKTKNQDYLEAVIGDNKNRINTLLSLPVEKAINFLIGFSGFYISKVLFHFEIIIIETIETEKWATTDNPVLLQCKTTDNIIDFLGIDTEILCPISQDYLVFIFHPDSNFSHNELRKLNINEVNKTSIELYEKIWHKLVDKSRVTKYIIVPSMKK